MSSLPIVIGLISCAIWVYLVFARGKFWQVQRFDDDLAHHEPLPNWPHVTAIIPARNEAQTIAQAVASLLQQKYAGQLSVLVVDDHSEDGTGARALKAARDNAAESRVRVHKASRLPPGWTGKVWALNDGVASVAATDAPEFYWLTDADIVHNPDTLQRLVSRAEQDQLDLTSLMVLLRTQTITERALIPPFLFFFLKLYPPPWTASEKSRTAGAAGGCILLRRAVLERSGGFAAIRGEVIDDCALARVVKHSGRIWMGLTRASVSLRSYQSATEIRDMIARTAFTQLRYSALFLFGATVGMFLMYFAPMALLFAHNSPAVALGLVAWLLMAASFLPIVRFYRLSILWAPLLPVAALFYTYSTLLSAFRFWLGRGAQWKGRAQAPRAV